MAASAGTLWAVNGTVAKVIREHGLSALQLAEVRSAGAFLGFGLAVAAFAPRRLRIERRELAFLAFFGVAGLAWVQWAYFLAIKRLDIGVALLIQYTAPLLVALYARLVLHRHVRRRIWVALVLSLAGLSLIVDAWHGVSLDGIGVAASIAGAVAYALYLVQAEHALGRRDPLSLLCLGFGFATIFFSLVAPWWGFPWGLAGDTVSLLGNLGSLHAPVWALLTWVVVLGTIVPFALLVGALRHLPATRVAIIAMLELVLATVVAWAWLGEALTILQLGGAVIVLAAIVLAQTARS
jgi:drug/metabolite transporter (DMT)-like permease